MENFSVLDGIWGAAAYFKLNLLDLAKMKRLRNSLSIKEICELMFPIHYPYSEPPKDNKYYTEWHDNKRVMNICRRQYSNQLICACEDNIIKYEGDIEGYKYTAALCITPSCRERIFYPYDCTIHKDEFKRYLKETGKWPVNGLLANWWNDDNGMASETPKKLTGVNWQRIGTFPLEIPSEEDSIAERIINVIAPHLKKKYTNIHCITCIKHHLKNSNNLDELEKELKDYYPENEKNSNGVRKVDDLLHKAGFDKGLKGIQKRIPLILRQ